MQRVLPKRGFPTGSVINWIELEEMNILIIMFITTAAILFLTKITSNTATGTMFIPIIASLVLAKCTPYALMLYVHVTQLRIYAPGTPPYAIIYGTEKLK
ncbi:hypothetical protein GCM10009001_29180 [Virgibacillus siamensis]|uniref:Uncharacterized protein n=1 Tax=Virgibacillus siamensis TaxID=480071 RepID=A0ABN1GET7_9BACI